ncbi:TetR family transcriptional regulator [Mycolicibacterium moriokaense]|uniref:HTH tetR-type domain-containing protein n=1 Tax=Mycolicibacterium moriokaense TaxID=39691 RepID=A0AAD1M772_9MYCO|nr:TetR/AcrR family transcriptional regulator [Mycolicibacterium moriokaense]MCV7038772.1 TetR/AcrR family transcriptional regulator [Mycolicibacterium moriokaense]ORB25373.1 TetR family transcriptional regulator [Mycolicibacterium moriokaense]BBX03617.1 hypothetical protein MMOR_45530 [Mycolicibacterium moriokaense]
MARPAKPLISRTAAIHAALEVIDADGLGAFSLPRLAAHMGVRAPSLYHHFRSRDEIMLGVARHIAGPAVATSGLSPGPDWPEHFVVLASNFRKSILRYPKAAPLLLHYPPRDLVLGGYEGAINFLRDSGVPDELHIRIIDGMETLAVGAVLIEAIDAAQNRSRSFRGVDPARAPMLADAVEACRLGPDELFEAKVRGFLRGVVRQIPNACSINAP